jgi:hypothetical protein
VRNSVSTHYTSIPSSKDRRHVTNP